MEKQISLRKKILDCKDKTSLCKLTSSSYFIVSTSGYQHYLFRSFSECVNSVRLFLYENNIIDENVRVNPYIAVSTNCLYVVLSKTIFFDDHYYSKPIAEIYIESTYNFQLILNRVLYRLLDEGYITELPF